MAESTLSSPMEALQLAGKIIMENGGETYRAEETICRMGGGFGLSEVESFAVPTGLFISYRNAEGTLETSIKRVRRLRIHENTWLKYRTWNAHSSSDSR